MSRVSEEERCRKSGEAGKVYGCRGEYEAGGSDDGFRIVWREMKQMEIWRDTN